MALDLKPLLREADREAERTVAIIRILIALVLSSVFLLTLLDEVLPAMLPRTDGAPLGPPPPPKGTAGILVAQSVLASGTIAAYLALGIGTLVLILKRRYRAWMAWPFATLDAAFALLAVWLSLVNQQLVGAYAPLLPAAWVLTIVLAFGALRYNAWLQAYLTFLVAGGLALVIWSTDGFLPMEWMHESEAEARTFLVGPPTVMRLVMLATAGAVLTLAVWRGMRLLRRATSESAQRDNLVRYLPRAIASLLAEGDLDELRRGRRDPLAVLFVDIRGFTGLSEDLDPADLADFMTEFRTGLTAAAEAEGGVVDKFVGDGAMIVFGLDRAQEDDGARALACARQILSALGEWNRAREAEGEAPVRLAMGGHWGEAFCGAVGDESRLEFTVLGDVVNVASRLESQAKEKDLPLVVSEALLRRAGETSEGGWHSLGVSPLRGRSGDMELFAPA